MTASPSTQTTQSPPSRRSRSGVLATLALAVMLVAAACSSSEPSSSELTDFQFSLPDGETITLAAYEGEPLVINYFASWCAPCRAELPEFEEVSQEVAADGVVFVGISRDNDTGPWQSLIAETGVTFDTMFEGADAGSFEYFGALGMPTTVFVAADGTVAEIYSGLLPSQTLRDKINEHFLEG